MRLCELSGDYLEPQVMRATNRLPFQSLFGQDLRVAIPLHVIPKPIKDLLDKLGYTPSGNMAVRDVVTQRGPKKVKERIGSIVAKHAPKLGDLWSNAGKFTILISRSPIDALRMADFKHLQSCHSPGGGHFNSARQEARTGGLVAFVVSDDELKTVDLQAPEVFKDDERSVSGVVPISRLRLRRFVHKETGAEFAVPERAVYGTKVEGFKSAVDAWAAQQQPTDRDPSHYKLTGGNYTDTNLTVLWRDFIADTQAVGGVAVDRHDEDLENYDDNGQHHDFFTGGELIWEPEDGTAIIGWDSFNIVINEESMDRLTASRVMDRTVKWSTFVAQTRTVAAFDLDKIFRGLGNELCIIPATARDDPDKVVIWVSISSPFGRYGDYRSFRNWAETIVDRFKPTDYSEMLVQELEGRLPSGRLR